MTYHVQVESRSLDGGSYLTSFNRKLTCICLVMISSCHIAMICGYKGQNAGPDLGTGYPRVVLVDLQVSQRSFPPPLSKGVATKYSQIYIVIFRPFYWEATVLPLSYHFSFLLYDLPWKYFDRWWLLWSHGRCAGLLCHRKFKLNDPSNIDPTIRRFCILDVNISHLIILNKLISLVWDSSSQ